MFIITQWLTLLPMTDFYPHLPSHLVLYCTSYSHFICSFLPSVPYVFYTFPVLRTIIAVCVIAYVTSSCTQTPLHATLEGVWEWDWHAWHDKLSCRSQINNLPPVDVYQFIIFFLLVTSFVANIHPMHMTLHSTNPVEVKCWIRMNDIWTYPLQENSQ